MKSRLSDNEVHDRLCAGLEALGEADAATSAGRTTLEAARRALRLLQLGLLMAVEDGEDVNAAVRPPSSAGEGR